MCALCGRQYIILGKAPASEGHSPYYFRGECGYSIMAVVPNGAQIESVEDYPTGTD